MQPEVATRDDLAFDTRLDRTDRATERGERHHLRERSDDLPGGRAALPVRNGDRLGVNVLEAQRRERAQAPLDAAREPLGAGEPRTGLGGERPGEIGGAGAGERGALESDDLGRERRSRSSGLSGGGD